MAVTMAEITKLRKISGAGMMDCKKRFGLKLMAISIKQWKLSVKNGQAVAAKTF